MYRRQEVNEGYEVALAENSLQTYSQALSPIVFQESSRFQLTIHQGHRYPRGGSSPSIGYYKEQTSGALWIGKSSVLPSGESNPEIPACLEIISAGIYGYYGVSIPKLAIGRRFQVNPKDDWIRIFSEARIRSGTHLLSRWLGRFTPYGEANSPTALQKRWEQGGNVRQSILYIDERQIPERGLGKVLAVALWLNDNDVMGGSGGNIGYEFQTDLNGRLYARTCKIDTGESFADFSEMKAREISFGIRIDRNDERGIVLSSLPERTQQEFLLTLYQIIQTPESVLKQFFTREGTACLQDANNLTMVQDIIGSLDWAVTILKARRQNLQKYYGAAIEEAVRQYELSQSQQQSISHIPNQGLIATTDISDETIQFMYTKALLRYSRVEVQQALHFYVDVDGVTGVGIEDRTPLHQTIFRFLGQDIECVLLLLGVSGSGKSMAAQKLSYELWQQYNQNPSPQTPIPILIDLSRFTQETVGQCIERVLQEEYYLTEQQIERHKQASNFVFILDGYDEIGGQPEINLYEANRISEWRHAKVVTICRSTDKAAKNLLLFSPSSANISGLRTRHLAPFSLLQIQAYVDKQPAEIQEQYQTLLQRQPNVVQLVETPFILVLLLEALPVLLAEEGEINRCRLYAAFIQQWFGHQEVRLTTFLGELPASDIQATFQNFAARLAFEMFQRSSVSIAQDSAPTSPWQRFFAPDAGDIFQARLACPLKTEGQAYSFIHKSFFEYFVADYLWRALIAQGAISSNALEVWNHRYLTEEPGILAFLAERLTHASNRVELEDRLLEMVLASRNNPRVAKAASSAITLLNQVHFAFYRRVPNKDLTHIHIPYADLSSAPMMGLDCSGMNAREVNFHDVALVGGKLCRADLNKARFLGVQSFILSESEVHAMLLHPTRPGIVVYGEKNNIVIARLEDGVVEKKLTGHTDEIRSLTFGPNGVLASGSRDGIICIWDFDLYSLRFALRMVNRSEITSLAFDPNGALISGSGNTMDIWNINSPDNPYVKSLKGHRSPVYSLAFSTTGLLVSGNLDGTINICNINSDTPHIKTLEKHRSQAASLVLNPNFFLSHLLTPSICLAFSPNGVLATSGVNFTIDIWNINADEPHLKTLEGHISSVCSLVFSPTGLLFSGSQDGIIRVWDINADEPHLKTFEGHTNSVYSLVCSPAGQPISGGQDRTIRVWDINVDEPHLKAREEYTNSVYSLAFSPTGLLISGSQDGAIRVWDINSDEPHLKTLEGRRVEDHGVVFIPEVCSLAFSVNNVLASGDGNGAIHIWDINADEPYLKTLEGHTKTVYSLAFSPTGLLASGSFDRTICIWDINSHNPHLKTLKEHKGNVATDSTRLTINDLSNLIPFICLAFGPNNVLASGSHNTIDIWNINSDSPHLKTLEGHVGKIFSLAFSPNGVLASAGADGMIRIWDISRYVQLKAFRSKKEMNSLVFSSDNRWLISGCDNEMLAWNADNWGEEPYSFGFGASHLCIHGNFLSFSHDSIIYTIDLSNFPRSYLWVMATAPNLWLQGCNVTGAEGVLLSSRQLLEQEGTIGEPAAVQRTQPRSLLSQNRSRFLNSEAESKSSESTHAGEEKKGGCVMS